MKLYTNPDFLGYHPNYPITRTNKSGGIVTKMSAIQYALSCEVVGDLSESDGKILIEPLAIKCPRESEKDYSPEQRDATEKQRIQEIVDYDRGGKVLLCSEMEIIRWTGSKRRDLVSNVQGVTASCKYQADLLYALNVNASVVYEPVNEHLFFPRPKKQKQIVAIGSAKHVKNTEMLIDVYRSLEGTGYHRVFIGSPLVWGVDWYYQRMQAEDLKLYHELQGVCDEFHKASPATTVARIMSESEFYLNFGFHEVCCRTAMEAILCGTGVIGGEHPLWNEYPVVGTISDPQEILPMLNKYTGNIDCGVLRQFGLDNFSFKAFKTKIGDIFYDH